MNRAAYLPFPRVKKKITRSKRKAKQTERCVSSADDTEETRRLRKHSRESDSLRPFSVPRILVMILSCALMLYSILPLFFNVLTVGILPPLCIGAFFFLVALEWKRIRERRGFLSNVLFCAVAIIVCAGIMLMAFLFGKMYGASAAEPPANRSDYTVVVLGCKIIDSRPTYMLEDRLEAAAEFLNAHPGAYCIVTGGQGADEDYTEAEIMKKYLISKGISEMRIAEESQAATTEDNINNSLAMIDELNLHGNIVVVTDRFHQYRARYYVEKNGYPCFAVSSETRWYLTGQYWCKEMVAVAMLMFFGIQL